MRANINRKVLRESHKLQNSILVFSLGIFLGFFSKSSKRAVLNVLLFFIVMNIS